MAEFWLDKNFEVRSIMEWHIVIAHAHFIAYLSTYDKHNEIRQVKQLVEMTDSIIPRFVNGVYC